MKKAAACVFLASFCTLFLFFFSSFLLDCYLVSFAYSTCFVLFSAASFVLAVVVYPDAVDLHPVVVAVQMAQLSTL